MKRRVRIAVLAAYLVTGAFITQGTICASTTTAGVASTGFLIDDKGFFLGLFNVCGQENLLIVDENGIPQGDVLNTEDDLLVGCPVREIVDDQGAGDG